jgi:hypothetical protein
MNSRYQPGGDIYSKFVSQYGRAGADRIAAADASGVPYAVNDALAEVRNGPRLNDSTASNFWDQITTDPLKAPLDSANDQIGKAVANFFKNPWVLFALALLIWGWLGAPGLGRLKQKLR